MNTSPSYDAIVVGARAAGAATALLLARSGARVAVVDRAPYGTDTLSTHALMRPAVLQLARWGLLDEVLASGAPPIRRVSFHYPDESIAVDIRPADGIDALCAPRRTVLDRIVADAAHAAGADIHYGVTVSDLQKDAAGRVIGIVARNVDGRSFSPRAPIVVGADGIRSIVARVAGADLVREAKNEGAVVYAYFSGVDAEGYEWGYAPGASAGVIPTNDGETCVFVGGSTERFRRDVMPDLESGFRSLLTEVSPSLAARVLSGEQRSRFRGFASVRGFYRRAAGEGWALVGDAGYFRDPITTHGIADAFRDAELLARAIIGQSTLAEYEEIRDAVTRGTFEVTDAIASYDWSMDELRTLLREVSRAMKPEVELILGFASEPAVA
jgi:menaquinone-9 beta-reductase